MGIKKTVLLSLLPVYLLTACNDAPLPKDTQHSEGNSDASQHDSQAVLPDEGDTIQNTGSLNNSQVHSHQLKGSEGYLTGCFIRIEKGDYVHITVKDTFGYFHTFFVLLPNDEQRQAYYEGYTPSFLQKLRIHWKRELLQLEGTEHKILVYSAVEIEELYEGQSCSGYPGPGKGIKGLDFEAHEGNPRPDQQTEVNKAAPTDSSFAGNMDQFQKLLIPNKNVVQKNGLLTIGNKQYFLTTSVYADCNGAYCVEDNHMIVSKNKKDTVEIVHWTTLGFFCDVNNDKNLDLVYIDYQNTEPFGHNHIYRAKTFEVLVKTLDSKTFEFVDLKDPSGEDYRIKIFWPGMWDKTLDKVQVLEQHWPYPIKWPY